MDKNLNEKQESNTSKIETQNDVDIDAKATQTSNTSIIDKTMSHSSITKKISLTKEQVQKLNIMIPYYQQDKSKIDATNQIIGDAIDFFFKNKYIEDIKNL
ncbi:MAG: hypothetical protein ACK5Z5_05055 [Neisseriaceae bacterium]